MTLDISLNKPILDLTSFIQRPLVEEISLAILSFISIFLMLWLLSKVFNLKKQDYKNSFFIAIITASIFFIIRLINLIFSLTDKQKPLINIISIVVETFLLLILIKKRYNQKWPKTILMWVMTFFGMWTIMGVIYFIIIFLFTTIPQDIIR